MKVHITGEMSQQGANKVNFIKAIANLILKIGLVVSMLLVAFAYFYVNVLK